MVYKKTQKAKNPQQYYQTPLKIFSKRFIADFHFLCLKKSHFLKFALGHVFFFIVRNCSFFMDTIFCSNVALVWNFNTRGVNNFITKKANILVNLVLFFNDVSFLFCHFLKSRVTNELKSLFVLKSKKVRVIYSKQDKNLRLVKP